MNKRTIYWLFVINEASAFIDFPPLFAPLYGNFLNYYLHFQPIASNMEMRHTLQQCARFADGVWHPAQSCLAYYCALFLEIAPRPAGQPAHNQTRARFLRCSEQNGR
jgi:hypothetical protein